MSEPKLEQIFFPYAFERRRLAAEKKMRFVHYSSAKSAVKLITNREVWMRKSRCMNDFSEIEYGMHCLRNAFVSPEGNHLRTTLDALFPDLVNEVATPSASTITPITATMSTTSVMARLPERAASQALGKMC